MSEVVAGLLFRRFDAVKPHTRRPASTTLDIMSLFVLTTASSSSSLSTGVETLASPDTRLVSGCVCSRRRLTTLGLLVFGLVNNGTADFSLAAAPLLLASDLSRGSVGKGTAFVAAAAATEAPKCRFWLLRRSVAALKVESRADLRF